MALTRWRAVAGNIWIRALSTGTVCKTDNQRPSIDFRNTKEAYRSKKFTELLRNYVVYKMFSFKPVVKNSEKLIKLSRSILRKRLSDWLMKKTVYGQFVAGEDLETIRPVLSRMREEAGVRSILDYAVEEDLTDKQEVVMEVRQKAPPPVNPGPMATGEGEDINNDNPQFKPQYMKAAEATKRSSARTYLYGGEDHSEQNLKHFQSCIEMAANVSENTDDAFAAIKLTGLGKVNFLLRFSEVLVNTRKLFLKLCDSTTSDVTESHVTHQSLHTGLLNMGVDIKESESERICENLRKEEKLLIHECYQQFQPGKDLHRLFSEHSVKGVKIKSLILNEEDEKQRRAIEGRAEKLAEYASEKNVRLMIDAEQTYFQPAISYVTVNRLMPKYNRHFPSIYNTIQCYLKEAETSLHRDLNFTKLTGCVYGVKLVRGAYLEQEENKAKENEYENPIWDGKDETDKCYNGLLDLLLMKQQEEKGSVHLMIASHNEETIQLAIEKIYEYGLDKKSPSVAFGQLLGMCDHITYPLGQAGYCAYKYVPYGPVEDVLPYLIRRANENSGMMAGASVERLLVRKEIFRRMRQLERTS